MSVRLPTVGGGRGSASDAPGLVRARDARVEPPCPVVAVGKAVQTAPALELAVALVDALSEAGLAVAVLRTAYASRPRVELDEAPGQGELATRLSKSAAAGVARVQAPPESMHAAIAEGLAQLCARGARPVVAVGNELPALYRTELTVLLTAGVLPPGWSATARALRDRVDLELADARPGVAAELAAAFATRYRGTG